MLTFQYRVLALIAIASVSICGSPDSRAAVVQERESEPQLVRVYTTLSDSHVGTIVNEDIGQITLNDIKTGLDVRIKKNADLKIVNPLSLNDAARYAGMATVCGWRLGQMAARDKPVGKIANIAGQFVYVTLGAEAKLRVGQSVTVFRGESEIIDPDSGEVLGSERSKIAQLEIVEVQTKFCKAKLIGDLEVKLMVGDIVEPSAHGMIVAVCPLLNEDGTLTTVGAGIAEDLTTIMVQKNVSVVERSVMGMVLAELLVQNTTLFDEASAQKIGKLTGANVVLTGKIVPNKNTGRAYVRLINVETGKILFAVSNSVNLDSATEVEGGSSLRTSNSSLPNIQGAKSAKFGRQLPRFLTTNARYEQVGKEGIRIQGYQGRNYSDLSSIVTKDSDFLIHDFTFEVKFEFGPQEHMAVFGLGKGQADTSYNGITDSVYLRFFPPNPGNGDGAVSVHGFQLSQDDLGNVTNDGTHTVRIIKEGTAVTFHVDPASDGPSDDDLELTIPDIGKYGHFFNSKNVPIFFGGAGIYKEVSLLKGKAIYPKSAITLKKNDGGNVPSPSGIILNAENGEAKGNSVMPSTENEAPIATSNAASKVTVFNMAGTKAWENSGIMVTKGQKISISAPDEKVDRNKTKSSHGVNAAVGSLLARIDGKVIDIDQGKDFVAPSSGTIYFRQNLGPSPNHTVDITITVHPLQKSDQN